MPTVTANHLTLHYSLTGPEGAPVVVFSNSLGTTLRMWDEVAGEVAKTYRVLRYDTRGHGGSQVAKLVGTTPARIDDLATDLAALLTALSIGRCHLVGLSLGGMTGQALAAMAPDRVATLSLLATASRMTPLADIYAARAALVRTQGMAPIADAVMARWFTPDFGIREPARLAAVRRDLLAIAPEGYAQACDVIGGLDEQARSSSITCPTLIIAGADDLATPVAMSQEMHERIQGSELIVLAQAAHLLAIEQAQAATTAVLGFLAKHA